LHLPHLEDTITRYARLIEEGYGDLDHSAVHMLLQPESEPEPSR
jgi:hypothetical protein